MSWQPNCNRALKNWLLLFQKDEYCIGCAGIKASCWFIQKKDWWLCDELHPNVGSLPFPSRHSPDQFSSYLQAEEIRYLQQDPVTTCSGVVGFPHPAAVFIFRVPLMNSRASSRWVLTQCEGLCSSKLSLTFRGTRCLITSGNKDDTDKEETEWGHNIQRRHWCVGMPFVGGLPVNTSAAQNFSITEQFSIPQSFQKWENNFLVLSHKARKWLNNFPRCND